MTSAALAVMAITTHHVNEYSAHVNRAPKIGDAMRYSDLVDSDLLAGYATQIPATAGPKLGPSETYWDMTCFGIKYTDKWAIGSL